MTFTTHGRRRLLACQQIHEAFITFCERGVPMGAGVGRYVLMPDHMHAFVAITGDMSLSQWVKGVKQHIQKSLRTLGHEPARVPQQRLCSFWQPGFMDHLLRSNESYAGKWDYVRENPARAGLVARAEDWPYQGEIVLIDRL